jgi:hypothetical protein
MLARTVSCQLPEGIIGPGRGQKRYGELDVGSYPFYSRGEFGTSLALRGRDAERLDAAKEEVIALVRGLG